MRNQTRQRTAIRTVLKAESRPLTAEEIHQLARKQIRTLGISTVYRSIRRMVETRELVGVDFPGHPPRYELPTEDVHSHFVCTGCQKVFDLPESEEPPTPTLPEDFEYHGYDLVIFGRCADCATSEG
ncbi:MAG TPA: transcriptional repressor [Opitutales bacterium]|nr:transcriptional repressor [Opitutales bacterium]